MANHGHNQSNAQNVHLTTGAKCLGYDSHGKQNEQTPTKIDSSKDHLVKDITQCTLNISVSKLEMSSRHQRKICILAHKLKRWTHEGNMDKFNSTVRNISDRHIIKELKLRKCVRNQMEVYDLQFTALDAQIEARRLKYDTNSTDSEILVQMKRVIIYTSNPNVSSMVYLARLGSDPHMKTSLDDGLAYLQYAKQHSRNISPCKNTGLMYYLEANLLSQIYELAPSTEMKEKILKSIEYAMDQFCNEEEDIRKDYMRMLMLRKAFCYLGLNLFGKRIKDAFVKEMTRKAVWNSLKFRTFGTEWKADEKCYITSQKQNIIDKDKYWN